MQKSQNEPKGITKMISAVNTLTHMVKNLLSIIIIYNILSYDIVDKRPAKQELIRSCLVCNTNLLQWFSQGRKNTPGTGPGGPEMAFVHVNMEVPANDGMMGWGEIWWIWKTRRHPWTSTWNPKFPSLFKKDNRFWIKTSMTLGSMFIFGGVAMFYVYICCTRKENSTFQERFIIFHNFWTCWCIFI